MNSGRIKNLFIVFLCVLAVYQTSGLWFEDISGRNFFYTFFAAQNRTSIHLGEYDFTNPQNIILGFGNKSFNRFFTGKRAKELNDKIDESMKYLAVNGEYVETKYLDWNELLASKVVICYYAIDMPMSSYMNVMGAKSFQSFSSKQKTFDTLAIVPARSTGENLKTYFINTKDNTTAVFSYKKNKTSDNLYASIEEIQKQSNNRSYMSTHQSGFEMFNYNVFLPQIVQNKENTNTNVVYSPIKFSNPYEDNIEKYVDVFFENPVAKWSGRDVNNGAYMYSDENIVVRYYPSGLIEYANYSVGTNSEDNSLATAFNIAIELIQKDMTIYDNMYLSKMVKTEDTWRFGFDYYINDYPIVLSDELKLQLGIEHMLEVTVKNGIATGYKHYLCSIEIEPEIKNVSVNFSTVLDKIMSGNNLDKIDDMYLSYIIDGNNKSDLMWIVDINDKNHYIEATEPVGKE